MQNLAHSWILRIFLMMVALISAAVFSVGKANQKLSLIEETERIVEKRLFPTTPVEMVAVKNKKGKLEINNRIIDTDDWLDGLAVNVKNISNKAITHDRD